MPQLDLGLVMGPQGPQGPEGPAGPQGPQGPQGEQSKVVNDLTTGGVDAALSAQMGVELEGKKADVDLSNLPSPQMALVNLGAGVRPNLLDNAYFVGGGTGWGVFPINQRGKTSYGASHGFDRWGMNGGTVTLGPTGVTWTSEQVLSQKMHVLNLADGKTRTVSYVDENQHGFSGLLTSRYTTIGDYQFTYGTGTSFYMQSQGSSPAMAWVKLEEGENQTLFVENGDGTVTLLPQGLDYGQELMKCQQYYWESDVGFTFEAVSATRLIANIQFPQKMRVTPTVSVVSQLGTKNVFSNWGSLQDTEVNFVSVINGTADGLYAIAADNATTGTLYYAKIIASAE